MKSLLLVGLWLSLMLMTCHCGTFRHKRQVAGDTGIVDVPDIAGGTPPPTAAPFTSSPPTAAATTLQPKNAGFFFGNRGFDFPNLFGFGDTGGGAFPGGAPGGFPGGASGSGVFPGGTSGNFPGGATGGLPVGAGGFPVGNFGGGGGGIGGLPSLPKPRPPINNGGIFGGGFPPIGAGGFPPNIGGGNPGGNNPFPDLGFGNRNNTLNFPPFNGQQGGGNPFNNFPTRPPPVFPTLRPAITTPTGPDFTRSSCTPPVFSPLADQVANTSIPDSIQILITQLLDTNTQLRDLLRFSANITGGPTAAGGIFDTRNSNDVSCPTVQSRATVFQRNGGNCWILQEQQPFTFATCKCKECLAPTGFRQFPGSACEPFLHPTLLFAYCENGFGFTPVITQERIALPVTCRCRHTAPSVTDTPSSGNAGETTTPISVLSTPSGNNGDSVIAIS